MAASWLLGGFFLQQATQQPIGASMRIECQDIEYAKKTMLSISVKL
jgi:hypothetical protein